MAKRCQNAYTRNQLGLKQFTTSLISQPVSTLWYNSTERHRRHQPMSLPPTVDVARVWGGPQGTNWTLHNVNQSRPSASTLDNDIREKRTRPPTVQRGSGGTSQCPRHSPRMWPEYGEDHEGLTERYTTSTRSRPPASTWDFNIREEPTRLATIGQIKCCKQYFIVKNMDEYSSWRRPCTSTNGTRTATNSSPQAGAFFPPLVLLSTSLHPVVQTFFCKCILLNV